MYFYRIILSELQDIFIEDFAFNFFCEGIKFWLEVAFASELEKFDLSCC